MLGASVACCGVMPHSTTFRKNCRRFWSCESPPWTAKERNGRPSRKASVGVSVTRAEDGPFNVIAPGKRPRVTLTPTLALKDGAPYLAFAVQGADTQDQNLLQFFLNVVEFGMTPQQAAEAPNVNSYQMRASFGEHESRPGRMLVASSTPPRVLAELRRMGYTLECEARTSGPINAILFDRAHRTLWGGSSNYGEDYGIAW